MAETIRKKIRQREEVAGENLYSYNLPDEASHQNHIVGLTAAVTENIDPKVRSKIKELVYEGKRKISTITALLEQYVVNELGETDKLRKRFYPQRDCIRSIVNATKREIRSGKIDLENVEQLLKSSKEKSEGDSCVYFRPCIVQLENSEIYIQQEEIVEDCEESQTIRRKETPSNQSNLLFIYQSRKTKLISECNSTIRSLQSAMQLLGEQHLEKLRNELQFLYEDASSHVTVDPDTTLPIEETPNSSSTKTKSRYRHAELPKPKKKKVKRLGQAAEAKDSPDLAV